MPLLKKVALAPSPEDHLHEDPFEGLQDPAPLSRRQAARALLGRDGGIAALLAALPGEPDQTVRTAMFDTLLADRSEAALRGLLAFLGSEDVALRNMVVDRLQEIPGDVGAYLPELLRHEDSDVRILTVNMVQVMSLADAPALLTALLEREEHANVLGTALDALMEIGDRGCVPAVSAIRQRFPDEPFLHFVADAVIKRIEG